MTTRPLDQLEQLVQDVERKYGEQRTLLTNAILEILQECGPAPESILYLAFQQHNLSLNLFNAIVDDLIGLGKVRRIPGPQLEAIK